MQAEPIIDIQNISYSYDEVELSDNNQDKNITKRPALDGVSLNVAEGELIAILGANGSGKSTLARHINALHLPQSGRILVCGMDTSNKDKLFNIRKSVGIVFQNPDNQIVGSVVDEDIGFGLENLNVPTNEIIFRVDEVLQELNLQKYRLRSPNRLSGGQKQRVAIAGILAMKPKCVILDEATAMLDPNGREEVMRVAKKLHAEGITVLIITHYMDEVIDCDRVFVMSKGKLLMTGTPREIFAEAHELNDLKLSIPNVTQMAMYLNTYYDDIKCDCLRMNELIEQILTIKTNGALPKQELRHFKALPKAKDTELLKLDNVCYSYSVGTSFEVNALIDISLTVYKGEFVGIIGHTGSGKSTLIQHFNGLNKPTAGKIYYRGKDIFSKDYSLREHKGKVGLVFQYAEQQLFEITILDDVAFGPINQGKSNDEAFILAKNALALVGMGEEYYKRSPFELSGGQKRRVAIAGVLAMQPEMLVLDEPTSGLDPAGKESILNILRDLNEKQDITIVIVSHSMEDIAQYTNRVLVMSYGRLVMNGETSKILCKSDELRALKLNTSYYHNVLEELRKKGLEVSCNAVSMEEVNYNILKALEAHNKEAES